MPPELMVAALVAVMLVVPWVMASSARPPEPGPPATARERRLWIWVFVVVALIYSTLGPMPMVAGWLRTRGLLGPASGAVVVIGAGLLVARWMRRRPEAREVGVVIGIAAVYVAVLLRLDLGPEERTHLFEYGLVAVLIHHALIERRSSGRNVPAPALLALAATILLGWIDEGIQAALPNRVYDIRDVGFNALAALMAVVSSLFMGWARGRRRGASPGAESRSSAE